MLQSYQAVVDVLEARWTLRTLAAPPRCHSALLNPASCGTFTRRRWERGPKAL